LVFLAQYVNHMKDELVRVDEIHMTPGENVGALKNTIASKLNIPIENLTVLLHGAEQKIIRLDDDGVNLATLNLDKVSQVRSISF